MSTKYIVNNLADQTINGEPILRPYKVYTALLTQSGITNPQIISDGNLTEGVSYQISGSIPGVYDFSNVGGPTYPDSYPFAATNNSVPNNWGGVSLSYDPGAPVVTILENSFGNISWTKNNVGVYRGTLNSSFPSNKTFAPSYTIFPLNGLPIFFFVTLLSDSVIEIFIYEDGSGVDGLLNQTPIEIRVYN